MQLGLREKNVLFVFGYIHLLFTYNLQFADVADVLEEIMGQNKCA